VIQTTRVNPDKLAHLGPVADVRAILRAARAENYATTSIPVLSAVMRSAARNAASEIST
jgi:hypothetical protein